MTVSGYVWYDSEFEDYYFYTKKPKAQYNEETGEKTYLAQGSPGTSNELEIEISGVIGPTHSDFNFPNQNEVNKKLLTPRKTIITISGI